MRLRLLVFLSIAIISVLMHWRVFPLDLMSMHTWRQAQTQSTIVNFAEEDFNILNPRRNHRGNEDGIFRMEFPIMQWTFAIFYKAFGNHVIISRILSFLIGIASVIGIYTLCNALFNQERIALLAAWAFNFSPAIYYYTMCPMPDNFALCMSIWGLFHAVQLYKRGNLSHLIWSGVFLCLGALSKLPFILYFSFPFLILIRQRKFALISILLLAAVPVVAWYAWVIPTWGSNGITAGMLDNSISAGEVWTLLQHHVISILPETLINYGAVLFFAAGIFYVFKNKIYRKPLFVELSVLLGLVGLYFIYELNMISTHHNYYLFPFLPLIFILVVYGLCQLFSVDLRAVKVISILALLTLPLAAHLRMGDRWNPDSPGFNKDFLIYRDELRSLVPKDALCISGNDYSHFITFYYIDKKGWNFDQDRVGQWRMKALVEQGAEYLYSDSRVVDENPEVRKYFKEELFNKGSIRVYSLQPPE